MLKSKEKNFFSEKKISSFIRMVIVLAMVGVFQFVLFEFDFWFWISPTFYFTLVYRVFMKYQCDAIANDIMFERNSNTPEIIEVREERTKSRKLIKEDFDEYLVIENVNRQKEAFEEYKLLLERKLTRKLKKTKKNKKRIALDLRIKEIHNLKMEDVKIEYEHVLKADFYVEETIGRDNNKKTRVEWGKAVRSFSLKNMGTTCVMTIMYYFFAMQFLSPKDISFLINLLFDLFIIAQSIGYALMCSRNIFNNEFLVVYQTQNDIMQNYFKWQQTNGQYNPYDVMLKEKEKEIEDKWKEKIKNVVKNTEK